jgi:hypothetical protein
MTDEDRRAFDNLNLLCLPHAEEVDLSALADRYPAETLHHWKSVQLQAPPSRPPDISERLLERATVLSMGDVLMDFREATIDLGGRPAGRPAQVVPAVERSGLALGEETEVPVATGTSSPSPAQRFWERCQSRLVGPVVAGLTAYPAKRQGTHALAPS